MKRRSIKTAILIPSLAVLFAGIIVIVAVAGVLSSNATNNLTSRLIDARVNEYTNEFRALCQDVYGAVSATTPIISNYIDPQFAAEAADPRGDVINILSKALMSNESIFCMWSCWEPNAFDGKDREFAGTSFYDASGRFIPSVYRDGNSFGVEALVGYDSPVEGEYYHGVLNTGKPYITDPYTYNIGGTETVLYSLAFPIFQNDRVVGVVGADINLQDAIAAMNAGRILDDGYLFTLSPGGLFATHFNKDLLMNSYGTTWMKNYSAQVEEVLKNGGSFSVNSYSDVTNTHMSFLGSGVMIGDTGRNWVVCGVVPEKTVNASSTALVWTIIAIGLALIVVMGVTIFLIVRGRLKELPKLTATADAMALGDIDSASLNAGEEATKNEISMLGHAFSKMTASIRQQADVLSRIAEGDYSMTVSVRSDKDVMNQAINKMLDNTNDALSQINSASSQVSDGSKQIADGAQSLASGATEQAASIEELSSSISEIAGQTRENAEMATHAAELSRSVRGKAEQGSEQMRHMTEAVRGINDASQNIGKVIKTIDDIAFQTNILALNAAVEAARAGQHGKGFAVVADEVRNLAAKSADAAKDTSSMIADSIFKAELGVRIAGETAQSLNEIVAGINETTEIVGKIALASENQSSAISQINIGIDQVAQVVQQNSATAEESAAASEEMSAQANILAGLVAQFNLRTCIHK